MEEFERLLEAVRPPVERFVRFRINSQMDADDVLQEVFLAAYQKFSQLRDKSAFKPWILRIAKNKCNDFFGSGRKRRRSPVRRWRKPRGAMAVPAWRNPDWSRKS